MEETICKLRIVRHSYYSIWGFLFINKTYLIENEKNINCLELYNLLYRQVNIHAIFMLHSIYT
jgi:hypothetical protein